MATMIQKKIPIPSTNYTDKFYRIRNDKERRQQMYNFVKNKGKIDSDKFLEKSLLSLKIRTHYLCKVIQKVIL